MNDPFACFDPLNKQKSAASSGSYATLPTPMPLAAPAAGPFNQLHGGQTMQPSMNLGFGQPNVATNPFGMGPPLQSMSNQPQLKYQQNNFNTSQTMQQPSSSNPFGATPLTSQGNNSGFGTNAQPILYDSIKNLLQPQPVDPFATYAGGSTYAGNGMGAPRPAPLAKQSSTVIDFDPFSPRDNAPLSPFDLPMQSQSTQQRTGSGGSSALADRQNKRQTQDAARDSLGFNTGAFQNAQNNKVSLRILSIQDPPPAPTIQSRTQSVHYGSSGAIASSRRQSNAPSPFDDSPYFQDNTGDNAFAGQTVTNLDDDFSPSAVTATSRAKQWDQNEAYGEEEEDGECAPDEYEVVFESGRKLGVLMERVDAWGKQDERRQEIAVVKLVVENGAADRVNVTVGSSILAINGRKVQRDTYTTILELIKTAPRPMTIRFKRGAVNKDSTQGNILTRISNGTFSVGNLTRGNAVWTQKYFAFGGAKMDVLQLFVSRAAYHECVISLYEKRAVHTQIQSFRLCSDHKISPIKCKIYKGYGNLHYFSLSVPSLRFVAAKFASDDYETVKNIWSHAYEAIERKKRMGY